ncbi:hypothetical protein RKD54_003019 [Pseudarthrobacter sp. SLBN-100]
MQPAVLPLEPPDANYRNGAHGGPAFLPWHREFLYQLETALRAIDSSVSVPFWDWTEDSTDPAASPVWNEDFIGGNGLEDDEWRVATGPFAFVNGHWPVPDYMEEGLPGPGLKRSFGQFIGAVPTPADLQLALREAFTTPRLTTPAPSPSDSGTGWRASLPSVATAGSPPRAPSCTTGSTSG